VNKRAFSLVELIFSIVIIGISFLSIPTIMTVISRSTEATVDTKGYYHALAQMGIILSKSWDENNVDDWDEANVVYILDTDDNNLDTDCNGTKLGLYQDSEYRRQCEENNSSNPNASLSSTFGTADDGEISFDDLDDFDGGTQTVENFKIDIGVAYVDSNPQDLSTTTTEFNIPIGVSSGTTSNIKEVNVTISNTNNNEVLGTIKYYGFNIGYDRLLTKEQILP